MKAFNDKVLSFTRKHRQQLIITSALVLTFALVFASVTTADYEPVQDTEIAVADEAEYTDLHCCIAFNGRNINCTVENGFSVGDVLKSAGIALNRNDIVSPGLTTEVTDGLEIKITRVDSYTVVDEHTIPYVTVRVPDPDMYVGREVVDVEGVNGTLAITSSLVFHDGVLVSSEEISSEYSAEPVDKVVRYGTIPYNAAWDSAGCHCDTGLYVVEDKTNAEGGGTVTLANGTKLNYSSTVSVSATAYTTELQSFKITYTGTVAHVGGIAVDPRVIPLGTKMFIVAEDGSWVYGYATAEDIGGGIKGNKVDLFYNTYNECIYFGVRNARIYVIG